MTRSRSSSFDCLEGPDGCAGEVLMRWPGYGDKCWPRCERHGNARLEREEGNIRRNLPDGPGAPAGFDPYHAGEAWEPVEELPGPDCFMPTRCRGLTSCPRERACSE